MCDCNYTDQCSIQTENNKEWVMGKKSKNKTKAWEKEYVIGLEFTISQDPIGRIRTE